MFGLWQETRAPVGPYAQAGETSHHIQMSLTLMSHLSRTNIQLNHNMKICLCLSSDADIQLASLSSSPHYFPLSTQSHIECVKVLWSVCVCDWDEALLQANCQCKD